MKTKHKEKTMPKKKGVKKSGPGGVNPFEQTDPIIVGGGGSVFIWMKKTTNPQLVDPAAGINNPPARPQDYVCIKCDINIKKIRASDGFGNTASPPGDLKGNVHPTDHITTFS
jgi:hypothetical protein